MSMLIVTKLKKKNLQKSNQKLIPSLKMLAQEYVSVIFLLFIN